MSYAPIVMFVYNRTDHFQQTFEALTKCEEAKQSDLFVFSDGPKNEAGAAKVAEVRQAVHTASEGDYFKSVSIMKNETNRGLAASVIAGVSRVLEQYGKVIVIEDDSVVSSHFLKFMNRCLDFYEKDETIGTIAGFTPTMKFPKNYTADVFCAYRSCSCGWATWKNRWDNVDWELQRVGEFYQNPKLIKLLNSNGIDRFIRLYRQTKGNGSSWSVRFGAHLVRNNWMTVYPRYSYIKNIGCDESGVHSKSEDAEKMRVDLSLAIEEPEIVPVTINKKIQKTMKKHYSGGVWSDVKRFLATTFIAMRERIKN